MCRELAALNISYSNQTSQMKSCGYHLLFWCLLFFYSNEVSSRSTDSYGDICHMTLQTLAPEPVLAKQLPPNAKTDKLRIGVIGLVHTHVHWILGRPDEGDIQIVGIVEPNKDLAQRYSAQHGYSMDIVYDTIEEMVEATKPDAVTAFNTIYDHLEVVEYCAPRGIHVMVEKPMSVNWEHAEKMAKIASEHQILLLTNFETTWYGSHMQAYQKIIEENRIGDLKKMTFNTGHPGPIEIGCNSEFLEWLTDPVWNGGGALTDFGCYGANLSTWFMQGEKPVSVFCKTRQLKPDMYPKVDDDATIIIDYESVQVIIRASWNWSHNRKDSEFYSASGYIYCHNSSDMSILEDESKGPYSIKADPPSKGQHDPFAYLAQLISGKKKITPYEPSSLENNLIVMQILEMAKESANTGKVVQWDEFFD